MYRTRFLILLGSLAMVWAGCGDDDGASNNNNNDNTNQNQNQNQNNNNNDLCGNGDVDSGETCDDGADNGTYGHCNATCDGDAAHCGDGTVDSGHETCDDGSDNGTYGHCNATCDGDAAHCGDGTVDSGHETCDDGAQNGTYDHCNTTCDGDAAHCGDGTVDSGHESCDDGALNGTYGHCNDTCDGSAIHCGDGTIDTGNETCDDGVNNGAYGFCNETCDGSAMYCGDGTTDTGHETCDDGADNGTYGHCNATCDGSAMYCGDGDIYANEENCDDGANNGTWGHCDSQCDAVLTCGDGIVTSPEVCDGANVPDCTTLGFDAGTTSCAEDCMTVNTRWCTYTNYRFIGEDPEGDTADSNEIDLKRAEYRIFAGSLRFRIQAWAPWTQGTTVTHGVLVRMAQPDLKAFMEFGMDKDGNPFFRTWDETNGWNTPTLPSRLVLDETNADTEGWMTIQIHPNDAPGVVDLSGKRALVWVGTYDSHYGRLEDSLYDDIWYPIDWNEQEQHCGLSGATFPEPCDGTDLDGLTCVDFGFQSGGTLTCDNCSRIDTSGCTVQTDWTSLGSDDAGDQSQGDVDIAGLSYRWEGTVLQFQLATNTSYDPLAEDLHLVLVDPDGDAFRLEWKHGVTFAATKAVGGSWTVLTTVPTGATVNAWAGLDGEPVMFAVDTATLPSPMTVTHQALRVYVAAYNDRPDHLIDAFPNEWRDTWSLPVINWGSGEVCGNGIIEGSEECDSGNLSQTECPAAGVPTCNSCTADYTPCNPGTCVEWTLVGVDPVGDSSESEVDFALLEYRVDPQLGWIEFRVSKNGALDLTNHEVRFLVESATGDGGWASLKIQGTTLSYNDSELSAPTTSQVNIDDSDFAAGELVVYVDLTFLADVVGGVDTGTLSLITTGHDYPNGTTYEYVPDYSSLPAILDWTDRGACWFTADGSPDPVGDAAGPQDLHTLAYNASGSSMGVTFDFHADVDLASAYFGYVFYNFSKDKNYHLGIFNGALYLVYDSGSSMESVTPPSCTTVPSNIASGTVKHVQISCAKSDLETALAAHNFLFIDDDYYFIGAETYHSAVQDDILPDDWSTTYYSMDPAVVP